MIAKTRKLQGLLLKLTCQSCPEQYEVYKDEEHVAYFRLRHGIFRVDMPDCGKETVYVARTNGDGCFNLDEREQHLRTAVDIVLNRLSNSNKDTQ